MIISFVGKELAGNLLLFVEDGGVTRDFAVNRLSFPEPLFRVRFIGCAGAFTPFVGLLVPRQARVAEHRGPLCAISYIT